jgi:hypothetical protein
MYGSKVNFQTYRNMLQQAAASSTSEMGTSNASIADSVSQQTQPRQTWSFITMPSGDSAQERTNASVGLSQGTDQSEQQNAVANQLLAILMGIRPERSREETQQSPERPTTGVSVPEVTEGSDINLPGDEDKWTEEEEYEAWLSREHSQMTGNRKTKIVKPYFNVQKMLRGETYLEDIPPHIFRIWLCIQNSYLSIRPETWNRNWKRNTRRN